MYILGRALDFSCALERLFKPRKPGLEIQQAGLNT